MKFKVSECVLWPPPVQNLGPTSCYRSCLSILKLFSLSLDLHGRHLLISWPCRHAQSHSPWTVRTHLPLNLAHYSILTHCRLLSQGVWTILRSLSCGRFVILECAFYHTPCSCSLKIYARMTSSLFAKYRQRNVDILDQPCFVSTTRRSGKPIDSLASIWLDWADNAQ